MERDIDAKAYGIVAFGILKNLLPKLLARDLISKTDLLALLDHIAQEESSRGVASDSDADSDAARLAVRLATTLRH